MRKTSHILFGLSHLVPNTYAYPPITYYALDLEKKELERTLGEIDASDIGPFLRGKVQTKGMCATYDDGLKFVEAGGLDLGAAHFPPAAFLNYGIGDSSPVSDSSASSKSGSDETIGTSPPSTPDEIRRPLHIMFLGSSLGNFSREGAADFLRSLPLGPGSGDTLLLGLDHDNDKDVIEEAYNDPHGHTRRFIMNGLRAAGIALGDEGLFNEDNWEYINRYNVVCQIFPFSVMNLC